MQEKKESVKGKYGRVEKEKELYSANPLQPVNIYILLILFSPIYLLVLHRTWLNFINLVSNDPVIYGWRAISGLITQLLCSVYLC